MSPPSVHFDELQPAWFLLTCKPPSLFVLELFYSSCRHATWPSGCAVWNSSCPSSTQNCLWERGERSARCTSSTSHENRGLHFSKRWILFVLWLTWLPSPPPGNLCSTQWPLWAPVPGGQQQEVGIQPSPAVRSLPVYANGQFIARVKSGFYRSLRGQPPPLRGIPSLTLWPHDGSKWKLELIPCMIYLKGLTLRKLLGCREY